MTVTTIPLSTLTAPKGNPRRTFDRMAIAGLAQSIRTDGILQNLIVRPADDGTYRVVFGKRRFLALQFLKKTGDIGDDYQVPVEIRETLSDTDALRIATVENVQREPMAVLDEAEAFAKLLAGGGSVDAIAGETGLSAQTIKRRLALANLCPEAKKALRSGVIGRSLAEALTLGSAAQQRSILEAIDDEGAPDPEYVRDMLLETRPSVAMAFFPKEQYEGALITDLFAEEETTYFEDVDQFLALQRQAVERFGQEEKKTAAWVDVLTAYSAPWWQYREAEDDEPKGVVIHLHPSGAVEIRKGLARQPVNEEAAQETREAPQVPAGRQKPMFTAPLLRYVAWHKTRVVQAALMRDPRKAKEVVAVLLLGQGQNHGIHLTVHSCHRPSSGQEDAAIAKTDIDRLTTELADRLQLPQEPGESGVARLATQFEDLENAVTALTDEELDRLIVLLPILCFGQEYVDRLDIGDSLFNRVAARLCVNMREWWVPDGVFLSSLRRDQLIQLVLDCGASDALAGFRNWTKTELVQGLVRFFAAGNADETTDDVHRKARLWLPGIMRFPATERLTA